MKYRVAMFVLATLLSGCGRSVDPETAATQAAGLLAEGKPGEARILLKNALEQADTVPGARALLARIALAEGDARGAAAELAALDAAAAAEPDVLVLRARVALATGRADEAGALLEQSGETLDEPARSILRAQVLRARGEPAAALAVLRSVQSAHPDVEPLAVEVATTLAVMGNLTAAVAAVDHYLAAGAGPTADARRVRGDLRLRQGAPLDAVKDFEAALAAAPRDWAPTARMGAELSIADALLAAGQLEEAKQRLDHVNSTWPGIFGAEILTARLALLEGRAHDAVDRFTRLVDAAPDNVQLRYLLADALVRTGNLARATELLGRLVTDRPGDTAARRMLATLWMQQGRPDRVIEVLSGEADFQPIPGATDDLLSTARLARTRAGQQIAELTRRVAATPADAALRAELAVAQIANGEPAAALQTLGPSPEKGWSPAAAAARMAALLALGNDIEGNRLVGRLLDPAAEVSADTLVAAADAAQRQRRDAMASRLLEGAARLDASDVEVQVRRASLAFDARRHDEARKFLQDVLKREPSHLTAGVALARVMEAEGATDEARGQLQKLSRQAPQSLEPALMLASLELRAGRPQEADKVIDTLITANPQGTAANAAGLLLLDNRRLEQSRTRLRQAVEQDADNAGYWFNLARAQVALSDLAAARESFLRSTTLEPSLPAAAGAVRLSIEQKDPAAALRVATALTAALPGSAGAWLLQGEAALAGGDAAAGRDAFARSAALRPSASAALGEFQARRSIDPRRADVSLKSWIAREPGDVTMRRMLVSHYLAVADHAAARAQLEAIVRLAPSDAASLNNLAWLLRGSDAARAEQLAVQARAIAPENPYVADTLGVIYLARGKTVQALEALAQAAAALPQDRAVQYHHALALRRTGDDAAARQALGRALDGNVEFTGRNEARQLLEELGR